MEKEKVLQQIQEGLKTLMGTDDVTAPREIDESYYTTIYKTNHEIELIFSFVEENGKLKIIVEHGCEINPSGWIDYDEEDKQEWEEDLNKLI